LSVDVAVEKKNDIVEEKIKKKEKRGEEKVRI
jgi:hypothetical protein